MDYGRLESIDRESKYTVVGAVIGISGIPYRQISDCFNAISKGEQVAVLSYDTLSGVQNTQLGFELIGDNKIFIWARGSSPSYVNRTLDDFLKMAVLTERTEAA